MDAAKPDGATETVSVLDNYERETRLNLKDWGGTEHHQNGGRHKIPYGNTAGRPTTLLGAGTLYINTQTGTLEYYDGAAWQNVIVLVDANNLIRARGNVTSTGVINNSFNVASVVRESIGKYKVTLTTVFANANYVVVGNIVGTAQGYLTFSEYAVGSFVVNNYTPAGARQDEAFAFTATGDQ